MDTTFYIQVRSMQSGESLIVSAEFQTRTEAESYKNQLIRLLINHADWVNLELLHTWFNHDFIIELVEADADHRIETTPLRTARLNALDDFERILEFMNHTYDQVKKVKIAA
ncbi:hypothetical protein J0A67_00090 [Algoriphagus aestuariicola]|uniref:Uncharacterized protein n=1 Tax=Algoriphagus aestuariicola TaxID=1852016 RepID=A0ABS3BIW0_9BACT|nr:hypothetical protein [Algoriphagus aestuariicola]MBN7799233.1 hypothetical protein [Algoriphagus aestuariicola]